MAKVVFFITVPLLLSDVLCLSSCRFCSSVRAGSARVAPLGPDAKLNFSVIFLLSVIKGAAALRMVAY